MSTIPPVISLSDMILELNPAQREAVYHDDGPILVIAGAGSGKTKTLVCRVARLISAGVSPESILLLTFTRKSSQEMLKRASELLDERCRRVSGGTFHGFANIILHHYAHYLGYSHQFTILDRSDSEDLVGMIRKELGFHKTEKKFPQKGTLVSMIGKTVNTSRRIEEVIAKEYSQFLEFTREITQIASVYHDQKRSMQVMDYDDLLVQLLALLKSAPNICDELQEKYRYIMVDEYQDTNRVQAEILRYLTGNPANLMAVGDDAQSIYSFRGADFKNIMMFPELFPGTEIVKLEQNYRSSQPILDLTNALIARAKEKYAKTLFTNRGDGVIPTYFEARSELEQSRFVAQKIDDYRKMGMSLSDMAVLIRSGWHSNDLEVQLQAVSIPFVKFGGFKFMESSHIKDVIAYMKIAYNPMDSVSWNRCLLALDGLGPKAAGDVISDLLATKGKDPQTILSKVGKRAFYTDLATLFQLVFGASGLTVPELMDRVLAYYQPIFISRYDDYPKRKQDLDSLVDIAKRYDSLGVFLDEITLDPPESTLSLESTPMNTDYLTVSTIHSAKGLEWRVVFLISAVDGYLPSAQSLGDLGQLEEERRLMYVALTRAKDELYIIKPRVDMQGQNYHRFGGMPMTEPSRFLTEGQLLDKYSQRVSLQPHGDRHDRPRPSFMASYDSAGDDDPVRSKYRF